MKERGNIIAYSCSGCSSAAQLANAVAIKLDRAGLAKMSCIAGVGGGVKSLVNVAKDAHVIVGIDGCPLQCVEQCLKKQGLRSTLHYELSQMGVDKKYHEDYNPKEAIKIFKTIMDDLFNYFKK